MPRLVYVTTAPMALRNLCEGQLAYFREQGYEVIGVASPGDDLQVVATREQVQVVGIPMEREIRPFADLVSLWRLWRLMRRLKPDVVTAGTSKAGLLAMVAAWLARVPVRVYQLWGLRLETTHGIKRRILSMAERITSACASRVVCCSKSLREKFLECGLTSPEKAITIMHGSSNGIRAERFLQTPELKAQAAELRRTWSVAPEAPMVGFIGRFVRDKGIVELVDAFERILVQCPDAWLLLVGDYESGDPVPQDYVRKIAEHPRIIRPGFIKKVAPYYATMSVMAFPTYREGFPNVVLEAAAAELPIVAFRATGAVDAVDDGHTGMIVEIGDTKSLADALLRYLNDPELRRRHGIAGRERVLRDFRQQPIWAELDATFRQLLAANGR